MGVTARSNCSLKESTFLSPWGRDRACKYSDPLAAIILIKIEILVVSHALIGSLEPHRGKGKILICTLQKGRGGLHKITEHLVPSWGSGKRDCQLAQAPVGCFSFCPGLLTLTLPP